MTYGANGHDLLSIARRQIAEQMANQGVQLRHLLAKEVFQRVLVAFFQFGERRTHFDGPPDL